MKLEDRLTLDLTKLKKAFESMYNVRVNKVDINTSDGFVNIWYEVVGDKNSLMDLMSSSNYKVSTTVPKVCKVILDGLLKYNK